MNIQEAQEKIYELSEENGKYVDQIGVIEKARDLIMHKRGVLLGKFPVLDLRRIGTRPRKVWGSEDIERWGDQ